MLIRNAGTTAVTVLALALGIGVNTAVFTAYKAFFLRQLDARAPQEMANMALRRESGGAQYTFSYPDYAAYLDSLHSFRRPGRVSARNNGRPMIVGRSDFEFS